MRRKTHFPLFAALAAAAIVSPAGATVLVYEGFNGYTEANINLSTPNANTVGLETSGATAGYANSTSGGVNTPTNMTFTTGLTLGSLQVSGGAVAFTGGPNVTSANIISTTSSSVIWSSYLVRVSGVSSTSNVGFEVRLNSSAGSASGNAYFRSDADSRASTSGLAVSYGGTLGASGPALSTSTNYMILSRFELGVGATIWALNAAQFDAFIASGRDISTLVGTAVTSTASAAAAGSTLGWNAAGAPAYLEYVSQVSTGVFDEVRYADTLAEVTPVPEPSAALLLCGAAGLGLVRRRR